MIAKTLTWNADAPPSAGDFLKVKDPATGEMETGTPAGGGGSALIRASGVLRSYTTDAIGAAPPPPLDVQIEGSPARFTLSSNTIGDTTFDYGSADPEDGSLWIDSATFDPPAAAIQMSSRAASLGWVTSYGGSHAYFSVPQTGSSVVISAAVQFGGVIITGGGNGADVVPPAGLVDEVELIAAVEGKKIKLVSGFPGYSGGISGSITMALYLRKDGVDTQISAAVPADSAGDWLPTPADLTLALNGKDEGESLIARMTLNSGDYPVDSSTLSAAVIAEQS